MSLRRAAIVLLVLAGAAACSDDENVANTEVGECVQDPGIIAFSEFEEVECSEPHFGEVVGLFTHDDGDFPGDDALAEEALDACLEAFEEHVGIALEESRFDVAPLTPTEASWNDADDRESICLAFAQDGEPYEGSLEGLGDDAAPE